MIYIDSHKLFLCEAYEVNYTDKQLPNDNSYRFEEVEI